MSGWCCCLSMKRDGLVKAWDWKDYMSYGEVTWWFWVCIGHPSHHFRFYRWKDMLVVVIRVNNNKLSPFLTFHQGLWKCLHPKFCFFLLPSAQDLGILKGRLNLEYKVSEDQYSMHRALAILNPTTELTGEYTCWVSSFESEAFKRKTLIVYGKCWKMSLLSLLFMFWLCVLVMAATVCLAMFRESLCLWDIRARFFFFSFFRSFSIVWISQTYMGCFFPHWDRLEIMLI